MTANLIQGTPEWRAARCGSLGASQVHEALAKTKSGWAASRANVMALLLCERLTGVPSEGYTNAAMQWGTDTEPQARVFYELVQGETVDAVGLVPHPSIAGSHASPDGLIKADGVLEIKCPLSATHVETVLGAGIPGKYITQIQWQLACTGRSWCDFVSFDPRMPEDLRLFVKRVPRDDAMIGELEREVEVFLAELDAKLGELQKRRLAA